jgi:ethanolamine utilization protein EutP (predicted NTPase)
MANLIQIRRSSSSTAPASLANGEIAYSFAASSNTLWIGDPRNVVPGTPLRVAGGKYAFLHQSGLQSGTDEGGVLTANAVVITNANNFLDQFKTNTIVVGPDGTTNAAATLVVSGTANISGNTTIGGNFTVTGTSSYTGNVAFDGTTLYIDAVNDRVGILTTTPNAPLQVNGAANVEGVAKFANTFSVTGAATFANTVTLTSAVGFASNVAFDTNVLFVDASNNRVGMGTTTPDATLQVNGTANVAGNTTISADLTVSQNTSIQQNLSVTNSVSFSNTLTVTGNTNLSNTLTATGAVDFANSFIVTGNSTFSNLVHVVGATDLANTLSVTGNATFSNTLAVTGTATFTSNVAFDTNTLYVDTVNNRVGVLTTAPDASLHVNGTANVAGNTTIVGKLLQVANASFSNTLAVTGNVTFSNTLSVTGAAEFLNTITGSANVNIDSGVLFVDTVNNRVGINDSTPDVAFAVTGDAVVSANLTANNLLINADAVINGNLAINGTLTTIDTVNLVVEDPMFKLGKNNNFANSAGDTVDLGFYGMYADVDTDFYTGLFRDSSDGKFKLFKDLEAEPTTIVDTANATFKFATLNAYLEMGGFTANTTNFVATANSTYNVSLTANSLTLSNKLEVTSGGTGVASFTTNGVLFGNGTANLQVTSAGTFGDVLQVNVSGVPTFGTLDGGTF